VRGPITASGSTRAVEAMNAEESMGTDFYDSGAPERQGT
jgi:hypothetical protein